MRKSNRFTWAKLWQGTFVIFFVQFFCAAICFCFFERKKRNFCHHLASYVHLRLGPMLIRWESRSFFTCLRWAQGIDGGTFFLKIVQEIPLGQEFNSLGLKFLKKNHTVFKWVYILYIAHQKFGEHRIL